MLPLGGHEESLDSAISSFNSKVHQKQEAAAELQEACSCEEWLWSTVLHLLARHPAR